MERKRENPVNFHVDDQVEAVDQCGSMWTDSDTCGQAGSSETGIPLSTDVPDSGSSA